MRKPIFQDTNHYNDTVLILSNFTRKKIQRVYKRIIMKWLNIKPGQKLCRNFMKKATEVIVLRRLRFMRILKRNTNVQMHAY